jgi:acylpyruvate hydrolase
LLHLVSCLYVCQSSLGDIILTGTPDGVGFAMTPPQFLKQGDVVDIEIEHIGRLCNAVL